MKRIGILATLALLVQPWAAAAEPYELVINNGRIIDPESGLDAVRHIGIAQGSIATLSAEPLRGARSIDAAGKVVAPGFIDRNTYVLGPETFRARAADGVTTTFNFEQGANDVAAAYAAVGERTLINFGFAVDHSGARMAVTGDPNGTVKHGLTEGFATEATRNRALSESELGAMLAHLKRGLEAGALAIGIGAEYFPGATNSELLAVFELAAQFRVPVQIHVREWNELTDHQEVYEPIAAAAITGATVHISHMNASANRYIDRYLDFVARAAGNGIAVSTECYPYTSGMTGIDSAIFDGWEKWPDERFARFFLPTTEQLTRETFAAHRARGGWVIFEFMKPQWVDACVVHPATQIASDGGNDAGGTHPRVAGTNSRVLGSYVRERGLLSLGDAIRKMTLLPARTLEKSLPQMARKGRLRPGADADVVIFDPQTVQDRATLVDQLLPPAGIEYVIVNGVVIRDPTGFIAGASPGKAIRRPQTQARSGH